MMMKKMRKIAAALVAVLSMTMIASTSSYAAEVQAGLIAGVQDAGLGEPVKMDVALSDYEAVEGHGLIRISCSTYGPGGYTFWIRDYCGEIGTAVPDELPELSGHRHDSLPEGLVFAAEPQEIEVSYYELSTGTPRKSSRGSGSSSRPTTGEPPKATGSDADHEIEIEGPTIKHDPTYDGYGSEDAWDIDSVGIIHIPGVPGTPTDDPTTGSPTTGEPPEKKEDDDEDESEIVMGELIDLGTITPIAGVPMRVDEDGRQYIELGSDRYYFDFD